MDYIVETNIDQFYLKVPANWNKLMLGLIGETILNSKFINGIRFVDKTVFTKKICLDLKFGLIKIFLKMKLIKVKNFMVKNLGVQEYLLRKLKLIKNK